MKTKDNIKKKKALVGAVDDLHSKIVRHRAHGICELCDKEFGFDNLHRHHIFGRGAIVRWEFETSAALCPACHEMAKQRKKFVLGRFAGIRGLAWFMTWQRRSHEFKDWTIPDLLELQKEFKELLKIEEEENG